MISQRMTAAFTSPSTPLKADDVRPRFPKVVGTAMTVIAALIASPAISSADPGNMTRIFTGDYCTGTFGQWALVQTKLHNGDPSTYSGGYPAQVIREDKDCRYVARFEARTADVPPAQSSPARAEVSPASAPPP